ncbi:MAG: aminotransferase class V-fold PLP-dependent enzyme [Balneolaceae bacterium]|nr:aminotransferase class V-fold PLP-dependent enzyme [Balneolaceae bacterium]
MTTRRSFLQQLSMGLAVPALSSPLNTLHTPKNEIDFSLEGDDFWDSVRDTFPLTKDRVYLNNGTFGPSPKPVSDALMNSMEKTNTTGEYGHTQKAREQLADFTGVDSSEISLTHNTTEGINIMTWGIPLEEEDEVIISLHEHVGNALPWLNRAKLHNIKLKPFEPADTQEANLEGLKALITPKTRVIALPHITCTTGLLFPIREVVELAKKHNIYTAIDGAHGPGTLDLDLKELGCDFYAGCCHKWMLGPAGSGFLYVKRELLDTLQAYHVGGYSDTGWDLYSDPPHLDGYVPTAHRYDYGTQSSPMYEAVRAAAAYHTSIGKEKIEKRVRELNQYLYDGLSELSSSLDILTPEESASRICMVTFKPHQWDYKKFAQTVSKEGYRIRIVPESNLDAIRISTHIYNSKEELDQFLHTVKSLI